MLLLRDARARAAMSASALAARAGVSTSTVLRIETGEMDPTFSMLDRLIDAAGERLVVSSDTSRAPVELARLVDAWHVRGGQGRPDWTRLRASLDVLHQRPEQVASAIERPPGRSGQEVLDALLAGIADKLADDHGLPRPSWTARRTLRSRWSATGTPRQDAERLERTPRQLVEHNVVVDSETLWREPLVRA